MESILEKKHVSECGCSYSHYTDGYTSVFRCKRCAKSANEYTRYIKKREKETKKQALSNANV